MKPSTVKFQKAFGYSLVAILALYLLISLYLLFIPRAVFLTAKITQYFNWFALPGPYFRDDRIRVVAHFTVAHKTVSSEWSAPRNVELENYLSYHNDFAYADLKRSRYERFMAKSLSRAVKDKPLTNLQHKRAFRELHQYLRYHYLPGDTDSVRIIYRLEALDGNLTDSLTTVFNYEYKPF